MRRSVLLGVVWTVSIVGLVSAKAAINCLDKNTCNHVRVIVQDSRDVSEVVQKHSAAREVDFHGNLLDGYQHPWEAQWKALNLSYNLLTQDMFTNFQNRHLETVDLTYNQLTTVSVPSSVTVFIAERNRLHDITIPPQSKLQKLILPKNQFDSLDKFANLPYLQELDLSCNDLSELTINQLPTSVRTLKLARNHIHSISGSGALQSLEYLDLSHNILTTILDAHVLFPSVRNLYLQSNKIVIWMDADKINNRFQQVNLLDNDWHCKSLEAVLTKMRGKTIQGPRSSDSDCLPANDFICCTNTESPYADRLIKYRKQEFKALQEGTAQRTGQASCKYEPNPCDGDDNLVYEMARSTMNDAKSLAEKNLDELEQELNQEKKFVKILQQNVTKYGAENDQQSRVHSDLVAYISRQYSEALPQAEQSLNGKPNEEVRKLQAVFSYYESENDQIKQQINAEERNNQDKLKEVNNLEKEMEELNYQKERLAEDVAKRNATVNGYKARIAELQKKIAQM